MSKIILVLLIAAVVQINGRPQFWFNKKDNSESKPLFGLPSLPSNPLGGIVNNVKNVAEGAVGNIIDTSKDQLKNVEEAVKTVGGQTSNDDQSENIDLQIDNEQSKPLFGLPSLPSNPMGGIVENVKNVAEGAVGNIIDTGKDQLKNVEEAVKAVGGQKSNDDQSENIELQNENEPSKPLFGLPSLPSNPLGGIVDNVKNVAEGAVGNIIGGQKSKEDQSENIELQNGSGPRKPAFEIPSVFNPIKNIAENIESKVKDSTDGLKNIGEQAMEKLKIDEVKNKIDDAVGNLNADGISNVINGNGNILGAVKDQVTSVVKDTTDKIAQGPGNLIQGLNNVSPFKKEEFSIWNIPRKVMTYVVTKVFGIPTPGSVMNNMADKVTSVQNGFTQNVAGAGAAMTGLFKKKE